MNCRCGYTRRSCFSPAVSWTVMTTMMVATAVVVRLYGANALRPTKAARVGATAF